MIYHFDPSNRLVLVKVSLKGPLDSTMCTMALDTGASTTQIIPEVLRIIGYDLQAATRRVRLNTASGVVDRSKLTVQEIKALGSTMTGLDIVVGELPPQTRILGLLGLDFFRDHVVKIDVRRGRIKIAPSRPWFW